METALRQKSINGAYARYTPVQWAFSEKVIERRAARLRCRRTGAVPSRAFELLSAVV